MKTIKKLVPVSFLSMLMVGCGGGDSSSDSSQNSYSPRASSKTQISVDAAELQKLRNVKYASNDGTAFSTPENFQK